MPKKSSKTVSVNRTPITTKDIKNIKATGCETFKIQVGYESPVRTVTLPELRKVLKKQDEDIVARKEKEEAIKRSIKEDDAEIEERTKELKSVLDQIGEVERKNHPSVDFDSILEDVGANLEEKVRMLEIEIEKCDKAFKPKRLSYEERSRQVTSAYDFVKKRGLSPEEENPFAPGGLKDTKEKDAAFEAEFQRFLISEV